MALRLLAAVLIALLFVGTLDAQQGRYGCQGDFNYTVGDSPLILSSDNYDATGTGMGPYLPYTWCRHTISAPAGRSVRVRFLDFEVESTPTCNADYLNVYDLAQAGTELGLATTRACRNPNTFLRPVLGPLCGNRTLEPYTSRREKVVMEFCADYAVEFRGWKVEISAVDRPAVVIPPPCGGNVTVDRLGQTRTITTPNYPENYRNYENCTWNIKFDSRYPLRVDAVSFDLGLGCADKVQVFDVTNGQFIGSSDCVDFDRTPTLTVTNSSEIEIRFQSDDWDVHQGFLIELSLIPCPPGYQACDDNNGCVRPKDQCDGVRHCSDGSDEKHEYCAPECGQSHIPIREETTRIVGGLEATRHSVPWQVAMLRKGGGQFCGGTVISDRWILTAAHCFTGGPSSAPQYVGRVGGHDLTLSPEEDLANEYEFETVLSHPYYRSSPTDYDYCLIKTKERIVFRKNVVPACLPRQGDDPVHGELCLTSGWGNTGSRALVDGFDTVGVVEKMDLNKAGDPLRHVLVPIANRTYCNTAYSGQITQRMICAGLEEGGKDTCQGDSGGPFMCKNRYGRYQVSGVVSWGRGCALPGYPGVYANTGDAMSWIIHTITTN